MGYEGWFRSDAMEGILCSVADFSVPSWMCDRVNTVPDKLEFLVVPHKTFARICPKNR